MNVRDIQQEKEKNYVIQVIRGICIIIGVIFIHCPSALGYGVASNIIWIVFRQVIVFPVAIFFSCQAIFLNTKKIGIMLSFC